MCYTIAAIAVFLALILALNQMSLGLQWLFYSVGAFYGTILFVTGTWALYISCRSARNASSVAEVAVALPLAFLPVFIGLVGSLQGFVNVAYIVSVVSPPLKQSELFEGLGTAASTLVVGALLTLPSYLVISVAMLKKLPPNLGKAEQ